MSIARLRAYFRNLRRTQILKLIGTNWCIPPSDFEEFAEWRLLRQVLRRLDVDVVLDVGANEGQFAEDLRRIGFKGTIISFEPVSAVFEVLRENRKYDKNWVGHRYALGSRNEEGRINVARNSVLSSIKEFKDEEGILKTETISVKRLDSIFEEIGVPLNGKRVFLKTDTQGFDVEVFKGAKGCIDRISGLLAEVSVIPLYEETDTYMSAIDLFESEGFRLCGLTPVSRYHTLEVGEFNCLMRRL